MGDMEEHREARLSHKEWRRVAKRERRRRLRRTAAQERDADEERLRAALERSAEYSNWRQEQERLEEEKEAREREEYAELERRWLEEEVNMSCDCHRLLLGFPSIDLRRFFRESVTLGILEIELTYDLPEFHVKV